MGRRRLPRQVLATKRAPFSAEQARPQRCCRACLHGTPPAAGRAWVPGCRVRTWSPWDLSTTDPRPC